MDYNASVMIPNNQNVAPLQPYQQYAQQYTQTANPYQVQNFDTSGYPQTGLLGSEQAMQGGLSGALTGLQYGIGQAQNNLTRQNQIGNNQLMHGYGQAQNYANQAMGLLGKPAAQAQAASADTSGVTSSLGQFLPQGLQAYNLQAALTGAAGQPAQQQAFQNYTDSPGQQFLRDQGMRAVTQNARAMGGIGGNQMKELQNYGTGLAAQNFQQNFNNLGSLSSIGANMASQQGSILGSLAGQQLAGQNQANMYNAQAQNSNTNNIANILSGLGSSALGVGQQQMSNSNTLGANLANLYGTGGQQAANYAFNTGQGLASGRQIAGQQIANINNQTGIDLSNLIGSSATNIGSLLSGTGDAINTQQGNLANLLANISTGTGSSAGNQTSVAQFMQQPNYMSQLGQIAGAASSAQDAYNRYNQPQTSGYYDYNQNANGGYYA